MLIRVPDGGILVVSIRAEEAPTLAKTCKKHGHPTPGSEVTSKRQMSP